MRKLILRFYQVYKTLGVRGALKFLFLERFYRLLSLISGKSFQKQYYRLYIRGSSLPLFCRLGTSDRSAFSQIFIDREYSCVDSLVNQRFIIDCGANVGYASAYFLMQFPSAKLIAIEPDSGNFQALQKNLEPYQARVKLMCSGVWSQSVGLVVSRGNYRDGLEWSIQVRECKENETPEVLAIDIGSLLRDSNIDHVDLLKVDIEGSEVELFAKNYLNWIDKIDNFVIELHDQRCRDVFINALGTASYETRESGELTMVQRIR